MSSTFLPSTQIGSLCPHCLWVGPEPGRGQQVADQLLPGSGAQHVLKDTDGLAALCMGREPEAGVDTGSWRKSSFKTHWHPAPGPKPPGVRAWLGFSLRTQCPACSVCLTQPLRALTRSGGTPPWRSWLSAWMCVCSGEKHGKLWKCTLDFQHPGEPQKTLLNQEEKIS